MTMSYLKKLSVEDALTMLTEKLNDALKPVERGDNLSLDAQLELDGLAALCRTYALDAAQGELTAAGEPGSICDTAAGLFILAETVKEYLDECMVDTYPDAAALMDDVMDDWAVETALNELDDAVRAAGLLEDGEDLYCMAIGEDDEIPELEDDPRVIPVDMNDETLVECLEDAEDALAEAGQMDIDEILLLVAGPAQEEGENTIHLLTWDDDEEFGDDQEDWGDSDEAQDDGQVGMEDVKDAMDDLTRAIQEAGLLEKGEDLCVSVVDAGTEPDIGEGQRLICYDAEIGEHVEALKEVLVEAGLAKEDQEIVLLAGIGFDDKDHDEDGPGIELVDMADLKDEEAEAVKTMADLLVAAGMMHPDQDICIAKVGVPADGRPYASLYIGDDTILTVTPG